MKKQDLLDEALSRGILSADQRKQLAELEGHEANDNDERIKPIGTMNEIFVTFGVILLLLSLRGLVPILLHHVIAGKLVMVGVAWLIALWFHERKRFRLPVIVCSLWAATAAARIAFTLQIVDTGIALRDAPPHMVATTMLVGLLALVAGAVRFRIPFLMLPIAVLFTVLVSYMAHSNVGDYVPWRLLLGGCGLAILTVAVFFDLKDPKRVTRWSDFAFWSYVVGSPLFVHSIFLTLLIQNNMKDWLDQPMLWMGCATLAIAFTFVGLLLNRRALILSTLIYVSAIIFRIMAGLSLGAPATLLLITTLIIGLYVTMLGSRWTRIRAAFMRGLPASWTWVKRLPPY